MLKWIVNQRQRCDLELILTKAFLPLTGFNSRADYESILKNSRLVNGSLWPIPIILDVDDAFAATIEEDDELALCDIDNTLLACMQIDDKWQPAKDIEAQSIFGTTNKSHPGVAYLYKQTGSWYLSGPLKKVQLPTHYDYLTLRHSPASLRNQFAQLGWKKIIAFQTRNPLHRAHLELTLRAAEMIDGNLLIHPVVGQTKQGDVDYFTRVQCYQKILTYYPKNLAMLSLLPLAMRMAGPKEALWHAIIRKNYGCTHFIVGRDHAGPGKDANGNNFYDPYAAQGLVLQHEDEIGIKMLPFEEMVYAQERKKYCTKTELADNETALTISGSELRQKLKNNEPIPDWFSFPEVIAELRKCYLPRHQLGFTLFFTGLSSAGKTTLAKAVMAKIMSLGLRNITLLDGDLVRRILSSGLGFSKEDRNLNVLRIGFVGAEITKVGGIALCAAIAPYASAREENRRLISQYGGYLEIYVSTPLDVCEKRDRKGIYAQARAGALNAVTGINDPYEIPVNPEITIDTSNTSFEDGANQIINYLLEHNYLKVEESGDAANNISQYKLAI